MRARASSKGRPTEADDLLGRDNRGEYRKKNISATRKSDLTVKQCYRNYHYFFFQDIQIEELQDTIPSHEPRYIVYSYKMQHTDGRISYPMCFIFYTPRGIQMELQVLYASMKLVLQKEADLTRCYEVRELEELTEDWLKEKLSR